jgi:archaellin
VTESFLRAKYKKVIMNTKNIPFGLIAILFLCGMVDMTSAGTDPLLEYEEKLGIHISLPRDLCANDEFTIEIQPLTGGTLTIPSTLPSVLDSAMILTPYFCSIEQATSPVELAGDVIGLAEGEHLTDIQLYLKLTAGAKPVNLNEMILIYTDKNTYVTLTPMEDKPLSGKGQWNYYFLLTRVTPRQTSTPIIMSTSTPIITATPIPTQPPAPFQVDSDGDGWSDEKERILGTNPYSVDSDNDGINDPQDTNPTVPEKKVPGFEAVFAISGLLIAVEYLVLKRRG